MAQSYNTLAGLVQWNDMNNAGFETSALFDSAPFLRAFYAQTASNGTLHKYLRQDGASSASFRDALDVITKTASTDTQVTVTLKILGASFYADLALARGYKDGDDAYLNKELLRSMRQAMFVAEKQIWYGTGNDSKGCAGLIDSAGYDQLSDTMVVNAGGSTSSMQTSCFLIREGEDAASFIIGNNGEFIVEDTPSIVDAAGSSSGTYPAYYVPVEGWAGLQIGSGYDIARIANIDTNDLTSTSAFTDAHISAARRLFKASAPPTRIVMNRDAMHVYRNSLKAVKPTGAPAPYPTAIFDIPVTVVDSIVSTEAVET